MSECIRSPRWRSEPDLTSNWEAGSHQQVPHLSPVLGVWHGFEDERSTWEDIDQLAEDAPYRVRNYLAAHADGHPPLQKVYDDLYEWTDFSSYGGSVPGCYLLQLRSTLLYYIVCFFESIDLFLFCLFDFVKPIVYFYLVSFRFPACFLATFPYWRIYFLE